MRCGRGRAACGHRALNAPTEQLYTSRYLSHKGTDRISRLLSCTERPLAKNKRKKAHSPAILCPLFEMNTDEFCPFSPLESCIRL
ncbi:unnamed protein product, partial [Iphiclides podalirius]